MIKQFFKILSLAGSFVLATTIEAHSHSDRSNDIVANGAAWKQVLLATDLPNAPPLTPNVWPSSGANFGILGLGVVSDKHGILYMTDTTETNNVPAPAGPPNLALNPAGIIWRYDPHTKIATRFLQPSQMANDLVFDKKGRLIVATKDNTIGARDIRRYNVKTKEFEVLAKDFPVGSGQLIDSPFGVTIDKKGRIYFSDSRTGKQNASPFSLPFAVYRRDLDGSLHQIITNLARPAGIDISSNGKYLYVTNYVSPNFTPNTFSPLASQGVDAFGFSLNNIPNKGQLGGNVIAYRLNRKGEIVDKNGNVSSENTDITVGKSLISRNNVGPFAITIDHKGNIYSTWDNSGFPGAGPIDGFIGEVTMINSKGKLIANLTPLLASVPPIPGIPNVVITPTNQALNFRTGSIGFGKGRFKHTLYLQRKTPWGLYSLKTKNT